MISSVRTILPETDMTYSLGSVLKRWKNLYLGDGTIVLDDIVISNDDNMLSITNSNQTANLEHDISEGHTAGLTVGNIKIDSSEPNSISTTTGDLVLTSNSHNVVIDNNLFVDGNLILTQPLSLIAVELGNIIITTDDPNTINTVLGDLLLTSTTENIKIEGSLYIENKLVIDKIDNTVFESVSFLDPLIKINNQNDPLLTARDKGISYTWHNIDNIKKHGFFGVNYNNNWTFIPDAHNVNGVIHGDKGEIDVLLSWDNILYKPTPEISIQLTGDVVGEAKASLDELSSSASLTIATMMIAEAPSIILKNIMLGITTHNTIDTVSGNLYLGSENNVIMKNDTQIDGTFRHKGLKPTNGTNIDQVTTIGKNLILEAGWNDTGIDSDTLAEGSYIVQLYANDIEAGGSNKHEFCTGFMSWYDGDMSSNTTILSDEIVLHRAGASREASLFLKTVRTQHPNPKKLKLQIYTTTPTSSVATYVFKFRRIL